MLPPPEERAFSGYPEKKTRGRYGSLNSTCKMISKTRKQLRQIPLLRKLRASVTTGGERRIGVVTFSKFSPAALARDWQVTGHGPKSSQECASQSP